ncbi:hypothetical protein OHB04_15665 [Streptomyces sp. NBC_01775]|uniref:hypothetical protein n=1 Tax=Streptomyces sp. NBC_01775 TaxID=2975939 RepID=UPI002DDB9CC9|nr:hypothetical protein [Streptomyces sp. NBC_01775]WSB77066.1 hypothetical protein OHB04_15665 [Streptomyces sp. NBC_01775]
MSAIATDTTIDSKAPRNRKAWVLGVVAAVFLAALGGGTYWWQQRSQPSQASAADCALAQKIVDQTRNLPKDKDAVTKWQQDTQDLRHKKMRDGYLGLQISKYESWAAEDAKGQGPAPKKSKQKETADTANSHCKDAKRTLTFPPVGS